LGFTFGCFGTDGGKPKIKSRKGKTEDKRSRQGEQPPMRKEKKESFLKGTSRQGVSGGQEGMRHAQGPSKIRPVIGWEIRGIISQSG